MPTFTRDTKNVKKPLYLKNGMFLIYAPRTIKTSLMQFEKNDTEIIVTLPRNYSRYFTSKFRSDVIESIVGGWQQIWVGILNRSLTECIVIKKPRPFGFLVLQSEGEVNVKHGTAKDTKKASSKIQKKDTIWRFLKEI